jgi:hypothetical protein
LNWNLRNKPVKCYIWSRAVCVVLRLGHLEKWITGKWKVLKCGAGDGWRRYVGPIVWEMECHMELRRIGIIYIQFMEEKLTGLVTSCVGTAF